MTAVTVIIPSTGNELLKVALNSLVTQTFQDFNVFIVTDGADFEVKARAIVNAYGEYGDSKFHVIALPENVCADGYVGHRIHGAIPFLTNSDYIIHLDEDNWFDANHIESLFRLVVDNELEWGYSLRKIVNKEGDYLFNDDCESLGDWPIYFSESHHLVDTNCYCIRRDIAISISPNWNIKIDADRHVLSALRRDFKKFGVTGIYSVNYRLGGNPRSVTSEFFEIGNAVSNERYHFDFPWTKKSILNTN
jgi:Glycosyl transferase family 2